MSLLLFLFVLSILIVVHEFGHFIVARLVGIRVEKFSIGFGRVLFGRRFGETEFCVSLLPFGGFVKLAGESAEEAKGEPWEFNSKTAWQKFLVVVAGPLMNAFLAFVLFSIVFFTGQPTFSTKVGQVLAGEAAEKAGVLAGDKIVAVNDRKVLYWEDVLKELRKNEEKIQLRIDRNGAQQELVLSPRMHEVKPWWGKPKRYAFIGIAPAGEMLVVKNSFTKAIALGFERVCMLTALVFASLGLMFSGAMSFKDSMTGPIGIFFMTRDAAQLGWAYLLYFMGSLSVSLFVLNLLPIPVLDGGHLLFLAIERLKGSALKERVKERMTQVGMVFLLALMAFVIVQDVHRFSIVENIIKMFSRGS